MNKKVLLVGGVITLSVLSYMLGSKLNKPVPKLENGKELVISIDGKKITADEFYTELKTQNGISILIDMVDKFIADNEVETTTALTTQINSQIEQIKYSVEKEGKTTWAAYLQSLYSTYGISDEVTLYNYLILNTKKDKIIDDYLEKEITDKEIETYYEKNIFGEITARHILIKPDTTTSMSTAEKAAAEAKALTTAKEVIAKLEAGEKWNDLVAKYTDDTGTKANNGELSFTKDEVVKEFWDASVNLVDSSYTKTPVKSEFGYHIIYRVKQEKKPTLATVKADVIEKIIEEKKAADQNLVQKTWVNIRKDYKIEISDPQVKKLYDSVVNGL